MQGLKQLGSALRYLLVAAASLLMAFPFYWMVTSALKSNDEIWQFPPTLWPQSPKWGQFAEHGLRLCLNGIWSTAFLSRFPLSCCRSLIPG